MALREQGDCMHGCGIQFAVVNCSEASLLPISHLTIYHEHHDDTIVTGAS